MTKFSDNNNFDKRISELQTDGIAVLENCIPPHLISKCKTTLNDVLAATHISSIPGSNVGHLNFDCGEEIALEIREAVLPQIYNLACNYLKTEKLRVVVNGNLNLPHSVVQHWHTDSGLSNRFLVANIIVDDFTSENGATEYSKGTHKSFFGFGGYLIRRCFGRFDVNSLSNVKSGSLVIRDSTMWHRGGKNNTDKGRLMIGLSLHGALVDEFLYNNEPGLRENWFGSRPYMEKIYIKYRWLWNLKRIFSSIKSKKGQPS